MPRSPILEGEAFREEVIQGHGPTQTKEFTGWHWMPRDTFVPVRERIRGQFQSGISGGFLFGIAPGVQSRIPAGILTGFPAGVPGERRVRLVSWISGQVVVRDGVRGQDVFRPGLWPVGWFPVLVFAGVVPA